MPRIAAGRRGSRAGVTSGLDQSVDLLHEAVDLVPAPAPPVEVVSWMLQVHGRGGEHAIAAGECVELFGVHRRTVANVCSYCQGV